jgi:hypothetical protein
MSAQLFWIFQCCHLTVLNNPVLSAHLFWISRNVSSPVLNVPKVSAHLFWYSSAVSSLFSVISQLTCSKYSIAVIWIIQCWHLTVLNNPMLSAHPVLIVQSDRQLTCSKYPELSAPLFWIFQSFQLTNYEYFGALCSSVLNIPELSDNLFWIFLQVNSSRLPGEEQ